MVFGVIVVVRDDGMGVDIFWWYGLCENGNVKVLELSFYVDVVFIVDGVLIRGFYVYFEVVFVDIVIVLYEYDSFYWVEEVIFVNGVVVVYGLFDVFVFVSYGDVSYIFLWEC